MTIVFYYIEIYIYIQYTYFLMIFSTDFTVCTANTVYLLYCLHSMAHTVRMHCTFIYLPYNHSLCMAMALLECKMKCILYFIVATMCIAYCTLAHSQTPVCILNMPFIFFIFCAGSIYFLLHYTNIFG